MNVYKVKRLNDIDLTRYNEGDLFLTKQSIGIIHNNKMEQLVKKSDIKILVQDEVKRVLKNDK